MAGEPAVGVVVLRFRPQLWGDHLDCYVEELFVLSDERGSGIGRALMLAASDRASELGADRMELGTSEEDLSARSLYESLGFTNREANSGAVNFFYERELGN